MSRVARPGRLVLAAGLAQAARSAPSAWRSAWPALLLASGAFAAWLDAPRDPAWLLIALATSWIAEGALYRAAFGLVVRRFGLHIGEVEWRLAAAWLLSAAFLLIIASLILAVLLGGAFAVASAGPGFVATQPSSWRDAAGGRGSWVLGGLALAAALAFALVAARLSLAAAATTARGRIQVLATWAATRGAGLALLVGHALLALGPAGLLVGALALRQRHAGTAIELLAAGAGGLAVVGLGAPLRAGFAAHAWRTLAGAREGSER